MFIERNYMGSFHIGDKLAVEVNHLDGEHSEEYVLHVQSEDHLYMHFETIEALIAYVFMLKDWFDSIEGEDRNAVLAKVRGEVVGA